MCGIAGKVSRDRAADPELVARMCGALAHRGPDSQGIHESGGAAIGMSRLAIIDLITGDQPLYSEDRRIALVLNGEIYNHHALRRELRLRGHRFSSTSDAEVVIHLYEEMGADCVRRLRGMFAFAIWDERRDELLLARDRLGKKPLVFCEGDAGITFASEINALLCDPDVPREIDLAAIDAFLCNGYVPGDMCAFAAVRKLPPACTLRWRPGDRPEIHRYWTLEYSPKHDLSRDEAREALRDLILEATRVRLDSDVPLGAHLSGGLDSSAVVAAMARTSPGPVRTYTAAFAEADFDEREHAARVAAHLGTEHHELEVGPLDVNRLPDIARHFGEPFADPAALPAFQLAELTRREVTVCLNGDGGDEGFAGYRRYRRIRSSRIAEPVPAGLRRALANGVGRFADERDPGRAGKMARITGGLALAPGHRFAALGRRFTEADRRRLYSPELLTLTGELDPVDHVAAAWQRRDGLASVDRAMATDIETYLPDDLLVKTDITSMAHSLEMRSPLLDHRLFEFAAALPPRLKLRGRSGKLLLREAVEGWLPAEILDRPKHGFAVPIGQWLRGPLRELPGDLLLGAEARSRDLFDQRALRHIVAEHLAGKDRTRQLWPLINLELWYRTCVAQPAGAPAASTAAL